MPTPTYKPLANITLTGNATTVSFNSINQGFKDIILVAEFVPNFNALVTMRMNGDSGGNYRYVTMSNNTSAGFSSATGNSSAMYLIAAANVIAGTKVNLISNLVDYSATDKSKTIINRINNYQGTNASSGGRWSSTSAMTSFTLDTDGGTFAAGSTFAIWGVIG